MISSQRAETPGLCAKGRRVAASQAVNIWGGAESGKRKDHPFFFLKIKYELQKSVTYSQAEHTYEVAAYNDELRNVQSIWVKRLHFIKWTWVMARLMKKNRAFVMQWGPGCLKWEQRKRRDGKSKQRPVTGVALTRMRDNCQALSKIKSKEICIKWHKQSRVHGEKNTKKLQRMHFCF